ncbi:MAG: Asp-tRNA(Asn)/Glu-tRNA(Gln) amidotransferase subunit GatA [Chloroflexi bacterium]|nr:Asp-tRNA(Asn)/Glu-tRNA(Gln) amidotransferase subunit GatA [Chloroflexota bacterium]
MSGLALASLTAQRRALARRTVSALELAEEHLVRIERLEPYLNAFILLDPDRVRRAARAADRALARGDAAPLRGIPIALKDIADERGLPNTAGSALRLKVVPTRDATVVARLRAAGAVFVGRTNLHEFAAGTTNANATFGQARNPHDPGRIPGGSSGGSAAAVAAGLAAGALGTDTAGSIRIPAALCGVVGLKPTYGRVSRAGVVPLSWSLDHVGPLARTVADVATLLAVMAGTDPRDPTTTAAPLRLGRGGPVRGLRFSFTDPYFHRDIDPSIVSALRHVRYLLIDAGLREVKTRIPMVAESGSIQYLVARCESTAVHLLDLVPARAARIGEEVRARLALGRDISAVDYLQAQRARALLVAETDAALEQSDVLIVPTTATGAIPIGATHAVVAGRRQSQRELLVRFTAPFNLSGHPALAIPIGVDGNGLPISLQVVGRAYDEATVLRVGAAIETALGLDLVPALARTA